MKKRGRGRPQVAPKRKELERLLRENGGQVAMVAFLTGLSRNTIYRALEREGLDPMLYREEPDYSKVALRALLARCDRTRLEVQKLLANIPK